MTVLYTCGNTNLGTVKLVASAVKILTDRDGNTPISKVVLFSSPETLDGNLFDQQTTIYQQFLGNHIRIERVSLSIAGLGTDQDLTAVFKDDAPKYVDLSNGQKASTSQLYLAASLLKIENIYYISLLFKPQEIPDDPVWGKHYEYVKLPPFTGISNLSRLSYFDLIFYIEEIEKIFVGVPTDSFLCKTSHDLRQSILSFFQGVSFRSAVADATTSSEVLIDALLDFLISYPPAKKFAKDCGIYLDRQRDPLGAITYFFTEYRKKSSGERDKNLEAILTVPGLLTPLRMFRNISAHSGRSPHTFEVNEVRICINLSLEIFRSAKISEEFWKRLLAR